MKTARLYVEVARSTFRRVTTYRGATLAGVVTNTVCGFILAYVLLAVFRERTIVGGFDATDAVTFSATATPTPINAPTTTMAVNVRSKRRRGRRCRLFLRASRGLPPRPPAAGR